MAKETICAFTGHRDFALTNEASRLLTQQIAQLIDGGVTTFLCGMAQGFDLACAQAVLSLQKYYPPLALKAVIPYPNQPSRWPADDKDLYLGILSQCTTAITLSETYQRGVFHARNRYLVNNAGQLLAYYSGKGSGTGSTVGYALRKGTQIHNIYPQLHSVQTQAQIAKSPLV